MITNAQHAPAHGHGSIVLYWLFVIVGAIPIALTLLRGMRWGIEPTLGFMMIVFGMRGFVLHAVVALQRHIAERDHHVYDRRSGGEQP